jgi:hypothetical protein
MLKHFRAEGTEAGLDLDIEVEPERQVYCFFGRNGAGKTVLLETLGRALLLAHTMFEERPANGAVSSAARFRRCFSQAGVHESLKDRVVQVPRALILDETVLKASAEPGDQVSLGDWQRGHRARFVDRPVVAIGAGDRGTTRNLTSTGIHLLGSYGERFATAFLRTFAAVTRQAVETESLAEWIAARVLVNPAFAGKDDRSFEVETMLRLLEDLDPVTFGGLAAEGMHGGIRYSEGKLWLRSTPIEKLPSGFIAIMKVFQEILGGYGGWTAFTGEKDLGNVDGIVLIDEIDAHVHPTWQARILPLLKRFFPRTTFFVCTHSPLVVSTTEEGEAYELVREGRRVTARKLGNPRDWYLADLCEVAFHVKPPPVDDSVDVPGLLLDFSIQVKDYLGTRDPARKAGAEALYARIIPSVPATDPRRSSLDALKDMLR